MRIYICGMLLTVHQHPKYKYHSWYKYEEDFPSRLLRVIGLSSELYTFDLLVTSETGTSWRLLSI